MALVSCAQFSGSSSQKARPYRSLSVLFPFSKRRFPKNLLLKKFLSQISELSCKITFDCVFRLAKADIASMPGANVKKLKIFRFNIPF
jgi:hypothetical protein